MRGERTVAVVKVLPKGQITLPKAIREALGVAEGHELLVQVTGCGEARLRVLPAPTSLHEVGKLVRARRLLDEDTLRRAREEGRRGAARRVVDAGGR